MYTTPPPALHRWFLVHAFVDYVVAVPLFVAPTAILLALHWPVIDPAAVRIIAAALLGIGGISFIARNTSQETYRVLVLMKLIWSSAALIALGIGIAHGYGSAAIGSAAIFTIFWCAWAYYTIQLRHNA